MGFRLNLKWSGLSVQSPLSTSSSSFPSSYSCRGSDNSYFLVRLTATSVLYGEAETLNDTSRAQGCSSPHQLLEKNLLATRELKAALGKGSGEGLYSLLDNDIQTSNNEDKWGYLTCLQATQGSRTLSSSSSFDVSNAPAEIVEEPRVNDSVDNHVDKVVVRSGKKELRKSRRKRTLEKETDTSVQAISKDPHQPKFASASRTLRSRYKRRKIARTEAEMASGVKLVAELEKLRTILEEDTGQVPSLISWAEAARIEKKELQRRLYYGWHCRDELLRSTRSLVLFIARNYRGLGVAFEDLIQAGNIGVLQGAERFDQSRGYKFSTYVQYWIRKSIATLVARHARGVRIPSTLTKAINQVHKARKALSNSNGKYPADSEIAKYTGLSIAKIMSASKCLRVVGSIDQNIGVNINIKFMEITADTSIMSPEEAVFRQHMINDVYTLLRGLEPREKQVIILRFGLGNQQCKSLEEIGRRFCVSKEWIRKLERAALTKLRNEDSLKILSQYVYMV
ncbi:hypothetical protein ACS0TY_012339 [Phlomoides rotata]